MLLDPLAPPSTGWRPTRDVRRRGRLLLEDGDPYRDCYGQPVAVPPGRPGGAGRWAVPWPRPGGRAPGRAGARGGARRRPACRRAVGARPGATTAQRHRPARVRRGRRHPPSRPGDDGGAARARVAARETRCGARPVRPGRHPATAPGSGCPGAPTRGHRRASSRASTPTSPSPRSGSPGRPPTAAKRRRTPPVTWRGPGTVPTRCWPAGRSPRRVSGSSASCATPWRKPVRVRMSVSRPHWAVSASPTTCGRWAYARVRASWCTAASAGWARWSTAPRPSPAPCATSSARPARCWCPPRPTATRPPPGPTWRPSPGWTGRNASGTRRRCRAGTAGPRPSQRMGVLAEYVRCAPGAVRSDHPQTSFAALGPRARQLTDGHDLTCHLGERSPVGGLYAADGQILLLGLGYEACTALHLAEYRLPVPPPRARLPLLPARRRPPGTPRLPGARPGRPRLPAGGCRARRHTVRPARSGRAGPGSPAAGASRRGLRGRLVRRESPGGAALTRGLR